MAFLTNEVIKLENAQTKTTAIEITNDGNTKEVTANAEQIPSTCTVIGLLSFKGSVKSFRSFFPNKGSCTFTS